MLNLLCNITAGDWLAFGGALGGALIGALITCWSVVKTIKEGRKTDIENRIIAAKPWLTADINLINNESEIDELLPQKPKFIYFDDGEIVGSNIKPTYRLKQMRFNIDGCVVYIPIKNVGGNTATSIEFTINGHRASPLFALAVNDKVNFILLLPKETDQVSTLYELNFTYGDVVSTIKYKQLSNLTINEYKGGTTLAHNVVLLPPPEKIESLESKNKETCNR